MNKDIIDLKVNRTTGVPALILIKLMAATISNH